MDGFVLKKEGDCNEEAQPVLYTRIMPSLHPLCFVITLQFLSARGFKNICSSSFAIHLPYSFIHKMRDISFPDLWQRHNNILRPRE